MATVVVLNGTSSSGKTTIARAFQELAPERFLNFSIDSILFTLPASALDRITSGADLSDLDIPRLVRAYYSCVRQLLELGHNLVIDNAITTEYQAGALREAVEGHRVLMVGLDCPAEVLAQRERERGDRRAGMAVAQHARIHTLLKYDLMIDSAGESARDAAAKIVAALQSPPRDTFERV